MLISTSKFVLLMQICATWTYMLDFLHFKFTNYAVDNIICRSEKTETESSLVQPSLRLSNTQRGICCFLGVILSTF